MTLLPFQIDGARFLADKNHAMLADDMGLGKSAQAITAADDIMAKKILILCPAVARINWEREFRKFSFLNRTFQILTTAQERPHSDRSIICSYDLAARLYDTDAWKKMRFDLLILDEAHYLKSLDAKRTNAVMSNGGFVRRAARTWELTGTPMPNHPGELWIHLKVFGITKLTYGQFVMRYCRMAVGWKPGDPFAIIGANKERISELRKMLQPFMLRRSSKVVKLPPRVFEEVVVEPGKVFFETEEEEKTTIDGVILETHKAKCNIQQLELMAGSVSTLRRYNGLQKVDPVAEMVAGELKSDAYKKIVIFAVHIHVIDKLYEKLKGFGAVTLYGATGATYRQKHIDQFQGDKDCRVFLANIKAAGTAITLTAASQVLFVEQEWTPGDNAQAAKRCHRIGQNETVFIRTVSIANSIDEKINGILRRKTEDILAVMDG